MSNLINNLFRGPLKDDNTEINDKGINQFERTKDKKYLI